MPPPDFLRAMTARPHLPSYFPDYDIYIWIDADCWVQDWRAVSMLGLAAKDYGFSVVAECDRSYFPSWDRGPFLEFNYDCLLRCFGEELAQKFRSIRR